MEKISNLLSQIDFYSLRVSNQFTFQSDQVYSTKYGKTLTVFLIFAWIGCFFYFGQNMFLKKNPRTNITENYVYDPEDIVLTKDTFFFSFGMQTYKKVFTLDPTIYTPSVKVVIRNESNMISEIKLGVRPCGYQDKPSNEELIPYFKINPVFDMYCLENYTNLTMKGSEDSPAFTFIKVNIDPCQNGSEIVCKPQNEIDDFFIKRRFYMNFVTSSVDPLNFELPLNYHGNYFAVPTQSSLKANIFLNMQYLHVETDDGFLTSTSDLKRGLQKSTEIPFFVNRESQNETYLELHFQLAKTVIKYERVYMKVSELFAITQGMFSILVLFFSFFAKPLVNFFFYQELVNGYLNIDSEEGNFKFTPKDYFCVCFSKKINEKMCLFNKGKDIILQNLGINQFLKWIGEIEKMKFLLLDKEQLVLFNSIPKPKISASSKPKKSPSLSEKSNKMVLQNRDSMLPSVNQPKEAYQKIKTRKNQTSLDKKLLELNQDLEILKDQQDKYLSEIPLREQKFRENRENLQILTKSLEEINENKELSGMIHVNADVILKDLETLKDENRNF